jgi:hypothetical protein
MATLAVVTLVATLASAVMAQDTHYWNKQYGNRAQVLGGALIGSADDASAVYYNPALLAGMPARSFTVAGSAYRLTEVTLANALGPGEDLTSSVVGVAPSLVAGEIPLGDPQRHRLAYSLLFRHDFNVVLELRGTANLSGVLDDARVRLGYEENVNEIWSGLSYARRLGDHLSAGVSVFTTYRTHRSRRAAFSAAEELGEFGVAVQRDDFDYTHIGLLGKFGLGGRAGAWRYGLTFTAPTLRIGGHGSKSIDRLLALANAENQVFLGYLVSDTERDISADRRTPASVGAGVSYRLGDTTVHLAAEWFARLDPYRLLDADPLVDERSDEIIDYDLIDESEAVANWGVGLEHRFGSRLTSYLSYHTDRSTTADRRTNGPLSVWDVHHVAGGVSLAFGSRRVFLAAVHARGDQEVPGTVDLLPGELEELVVTDLPRGLEARYRSFMLLVGFNVDY